jgi:hypothetical protein
MLLEIKQQKNGTIILRAPDGEIHAFSTKDVDKETADKLFADIGRTVLEILADPDQPELKTETNGAHVRQSVADDGPTIEGDGSTEGALRGFLDALVPGVPLSRGLDFLQSMSSDEETGS